MPCDPDREGQEFIALARDPEDAATQIRRT